MYQLLNKHVYTYKIKAGDDFMKEIWRPIKGYENLYEVSNKGRVRSLTKYCMRFGCRKTLIRGKLLSIRKNASGYIMVSLAKKGTKKQVLIHRLVAQAFIPNPNNYPIINHKDENPSNNNVNNLEWCTQKYNVNYGTARSRTRITNKINRSKGKTDIDKVLLKTHITKTALAKELGISKSTLRIWIEKSENGYRKKEILDEIKELEKRWQKDRQKQINDLIEFRKEAKRIFR